MMPLHRVPLGFVVCVLGCAAPAVTDHDASGPDASDDAPREPDAGLGDAPTEGDSGADSAAASPSISGTATFYELAGAQSKALALMVSFHAPAPHAYDDRQGGLGCTADHYDALSTPLPPDSAAGLVRAAGFVEGKTLSGDIAANPIGCVRPGAYYSCTYPAGASAFDARFALSASPLGAGPIAFAVNGGPDFGAVYASGSPEDGTLALAEDLASVRYAPAQDTVLHATCSSACPSARIAFELRAFAAASAASAWPYPSVGLVRCVFAPAGSITVPHAAVAAALASDTRLDSITTMVVRLTHDPLQARDLNGNVLTADIGRGVFGTAPR
jgi:hypothetical protein